MRTDTPRGVPAPDDESSAKGTVANPRTTQQDYLPFIWQRLDSLDARLSSICQTLGRLDARLESMSEQRQDLVQRIDKLDGKVSGLEKSLIRAGAYVAGAISLCGLLYALYRFLEPHITIGLR